MRNEECLEKIDWTVEHCGMRTDHANECKAALALKKEHTQFWGMSTDALIPLIHEKNEEVKSKIIKLVAKGGERKGELYGTQDKMKAAINREKRKKVEPAQLPEGVFLYNLWDLEPKRIRGYGDGSYHGVTPVEVCIHTLRAYGDKNALCLDSMSGSGTFKDVADKLGYNCDVSDLENGVDARKIDKPDAYYTLIFNHFPYWNMVKYSDMESDLSKAKTKEDFLKMVKTVFTENYRLLKKGGFYAVMIGDLRRDRQTVWLGCDFVRIGIEVGFETYDNAYINTLGTTHKSSGIAEWRAREHNFMKPSVDWLLIFRR